ncbi:MAG: hypothetical protein CHACPFDD_00046 [Phycisphaerae bacterium]|nr:hypothetical protein [Phycisphaerae bacterium]
MTVATLTPHLAARPTTRCTSRSAAAAFADVADWDRLCQSTPHTPFGASYWYVPLWRALEGATAALRVHEVSAGDEAMAVAPLRLCGRLIRTWRPLYNPHVPFVDFPLRGDAEIAAAALLDHLSGTADRVEIPKISADGSWAVALQRAAQRRGMPLVVEPQLGDAVLPLGEDWAGCGEALPKSLAQLNGRRERQLRNLGTLEFEVVTQHADLDRLLDACFQIEAASWKGANQSAISSRPQTLAFYQSLAHAAAAHGALRIYLLRLNGTLIAFEYCLAGGGVVYLLKLSFDPQYGKYSPGNVLRMLLLRHAVETRDAHTYNFGIESEWKSRWTQRVEPMLRLAIYFRHARGRAAYACGVGLRRMLRENPLTGGLLRALRSARDRRRAQRKAAARAKTCAAEPRR